MNVLVCTKQDLHGAVFLNALLPALHGHRVVGVWLSDSVRPAERELPELALLHRLERTLPLQQVFPRSGDGAELMGFEALARRFAVPVQVVPEVIGEPARARLAATGAELVVVARFSQLFDAATLALPRCGMVNVHPGRLPRFAGLHAPLRSVLAGEADLGCSVHWITEGIDAGPLLARHAVPVQPHAGLLEQIAGLYPLAVPTLVELADACAAGRRPAGEPQDLGQRRYRSLPDRSEFAALRQRGMPLWQEAGYSGLLRRFLPPGAALPALPSP